MSRLRLLLTALSCAACATANPPPELLAARSAYAQAETGEAGRYKPDELHEARVLLDQAEAQFKNDAHGEKTLTAAYLAQRKAQLAEADGAIADYERNKTDATSQLTKVATAGLQRTQGELSATREQLASETTARMAAEQRAKDALDKLAAASVPVKQETRGTVITLPGSVLFASGKSSLLASAQDKLGEVAAALKDQKDHQITVEGHTDSRGRDETNQALSQRRADSVRAFLISRGLDADQVTAVGLGSSRPVADNATAEGRADNRRVEIVVKPIEAK